MTTTNKWLPVALLGLLVSACSSDKSSPTGPGPSTPQNQTLFSLNGIVTSGGVGLPGATVLIADGINGGRAATTDGAGNYGFTNVTLSSFTLSASASGFQSQNKSVSLTSNQLVSFSLARINPIFVMAGVGNTVFNMPTYVSRVRIQGSYTGYSSNLIIKVGGKLVVNELIGTGWGPTTYDGTHLVSGGTTEITNSSGVSWSFTEQR
jgi:hypothetical protein